MTEYGVELNTGAIWDAARRLHMYVQHVLAPTLKRGNVVALDNLPAHKVADIPEAIAERCARQFDVASPHSLRSD